MKLVSAFVGLAALGGVTLSSGAASAAPIEVPTGYVCNEWGHCWQRHYHGGYYHPHYWGGTAGTIIGVTAGAGIIGLAGTAGIIGTTGEI